MLRASSLRMMATSAPRRGVLATSAPRLANFGQPTAHQPRWVDDWEKDTRVGKDRLDWFFRALAKTRVYEVFLKSTPIFWAFTFWSGIIGGYYYSVFWDWNWERINKGKIYRHCPYVYPADEEESQVVFSEITCVLACQLCVFVCVSACVRVPSIAQRIRNKRHTEVCIQIYRHEKNDFYAYLSYWCVRV